MATAIQLITRAMRLAGMIGTGETPSDTESADGLTALNSMLDSWTIERLFVPYIATNTLTFTPGTATYTMGVGGDINTTYRPSQIDDSCYITYGSVDIPLTLVDNDAYSAIVAKTVQSNLPLYLYVKMDYPLIHLSFYPVPSSAAAVATIKSWAQLQSFATLTDALTLPAGWERAITYSLAVEYGPEFGAQVPDDVKRIAIRSTANLKRINAPSPIMRSEAGYMNRYIRPYSIYSG